MSAPSNQSYYQQAKCDSACEFSSEDAEKPRRSLSLLKDALLHGKHTAKQNYREYLQQASADSSFSGAINSQVNSQSHPYQVSSAEYHLRPTQTSAGCEQLLQQYLYSYAYPDQNVQSHNYELPGPSTSMQYVQNEPKQQTVNVQETQMCNYSGNNNNNVKQRNNNIAAPGYHPAPIPTYPWMQRKGGQGNGNEQKRTRQTYTREQICLLEQEFVASKYLPKRRRAEVATRIHLNERQVKIWFQNRRMKEKKGFAEKSALLNPNLAMDTSMASNLRPKVSTQVTYEQQLLNSASQMHLHDSPHYEEQQYYAGNRNALTTNYLNTPASSGSYENAVMRPSSNSEFVVNTYSFVSSL
ncbi:hypothetical protein PUN28_006982 [Cardiocondyla obscurior]